MTAAKKQTITIDQLRNLTRCNSADKGNKYHARRVGRHASKKEHDRWGQLTLMQRAGIISQLREQVPYLLIPDQRDKAGTIIEHGIRYIADFVYIDSDGNVIVEDTKGFRTPEYKIKRKLMLFIHGIRIKEV